MMLKSQLRMPIEQHLSRQQDQPVRKNLYGPEINIREYTLPKFSMEAVADTIISPWQNEKDGKGKLEMSPVELKKPDKYFLMFFEKATDFLNIRTYDGEDGHEVYVLRDLYDSFLTEYASDAYPKSQIRTGLFLGTGYVYNVANSYTNGMLREELKKIICYPDNHEPLKRAIFESMVDRGKGYTFPERADFFQRTNPSLTIPAHQTSLREGLDTLRSMFPTVEFAIEDGAISAYRTLEKLWPQLGLNHGFEA